MDFFTIGVYNSTETDFFGKLTENNIDTFCDIRQRRGVRGSKYAFVNATRLQHKLAELGIQYGHIIGLAPTTEIRELQKKADIISGEQKSNRVNLSNTFIDSYNSIILKEFDFDYLLEMLEEQGSRRIVFFCVEEQPEACHRSLVTNALSKKGMNIMHL
jgi:uncharacterized protein (DUF488 family)